MEQLNRYFDHTILSPEATREDVVRLCDEAKAYHFFAVCVNSGYVKLAAEKLSGSEVKVAAVVGFPLGACATEAKVFETELSCRDGASEIDMVISIGALKEGDDEYVQADIAAVVTAAAKQGAIVKVILETCLLTKGEIVRACNLSKAAGAAFVKTSTGFSKAGAEVEDVKRMKDTVGASMQVKASGGIRDLSKALEMVEAGADRIGASASCTIMEELRAKG